MLNIVWPIFIILSFTYAIFSGNLDNLNSSIFSSTEEAVSLSISLLRYHLSMEWNYENCI